MELNDSPRFAGEKAKEIYETILEAAKKPSNKEKREKRLKDYSEKIHKK